MFVSLLTSGSIISSLIYVKKSSYELERLSESQQGASEQDRKNLMMTPDCYYCHEKKKVHPLLI